MGVESQDESGKYVIDKLATHIHIIQTMNEIPLFLAICEEHHTLGKSDWLGANTIAQEHLQTFGCSQPIHVVHEQPWNISVNVLKENAEEEIKQLGHEAKIIYQYGTH